MKFWLFVAAIAAGGWYWQVGGRQISESDVRSHYTKQLEWIDANDHKSMCESLHSTYQAKSTSISVAGRMSEEADKAAACRNLEEFYASVNAMNDQMGGGVVTNAEVTIDNIEISGDKRRAVVTTRSELRVGTAQVLMMKFNTQATDTYVKHNGKMQAVLSESKVLIQ